MNVLVTGGAGFIGSYVVRELIRAHHTVVAYDIQVTQNSLDHVLSDDERSRVILVAGDMTNTAGLNETIRQYDIETIAHLASPLSAQTEDNPAFAIRNMIEAQYVLLEAARMAKVLRLSGPVRLECMAPHRCTPRYLSLIARHTILLRYMVRVSRSMNIFLRISRINMGSILWACASLSCMVLAAYGETVCTSLI